MKPLKLLFAGTPDIAACGLQSLLPTQHIIQAVLTQPDRPSGRGRKLTPSPVKQLALDHDIEILQPTSLKSEEIQQTLKSYDADLMIVIAYGLLLPQAVLDIPTHGAWNVHVSLLPRWRGAAPIQRAIEHGDAETGVCIMQMDAGLDTGPIINRATCPISATDTSLTLHDKLAELGASALVDSLECLTQKQIMLTEQATTGITYAKKLTKDEAWINWHHSAHEIDAMIRAFNPWPIAQTSIDDKTIRIHEVLPVDSEVSDKPGTIVKASKHGIEVCTGRSIINITRLQLPGKKTLPAKDVLNAYANLFKEGNTFK